MAADGDTKIQAYIQGAKLKGIVDGDALPYPDTMQTSPCVVANSTAAKKPV